MCKICKVFSINFILIRCGSVKYNCKTENVFVVCHMIRHTAKDFAVCHSTGHTAKGAALPWARSGHTAKRPPLSPLSLTHATHTQTHTRTPYVSYLPVTPARAHANAAGQACARAPPCPRSVPDATLAAPTRPRAHICR